MRPEAELFIGLAAAGHDITVMTQGDSVYAGAMRDAGIRVIDFVPARKLSLAAIRRLRAELSGGGYDIVYSFNNKAIANVNVAAIGCPVTVVTYRGQTGNVHRYDPSAYLTHLHPRVDGILAVAEAVRESLLPHVSDPGKVITVYKGHDLDWYRDEPVRRADIGLGDDDFAVACVSNNRPRKGIPVLIDAVAALRDLADLRLVLIGAGMDAPALVRSIEAHGLADRLRLLGFRSDAPAVLHACDVSVLPSTKREGLPKVVIESMVYGVPAIVTDTGGSAELVEHGDSGLVVPPGDAAALADAIRYCHDHRDDAKRMGAAGRRRIGHHFSVQQTVTDTIAAFERLRQRKRR